MDRPSTMHIRFASITGNGEMVADELALFLIGSGFDVRVDNLSDVHLERWDRDALHIFVCSTHGDGDLPWPAYAAFRAIRDREVDVSGMQYAMFGLGDSGYVYSYCVGSDHLDRALTAGGALRVGPYGRHDAASGPSADVAAVEWATRLLGMVPTPR